jgi:hypothetical protein
MSSKYFVGLRLMLVSSLPLGLLGHSLWASDIAPLPVTGAPGLPPLNMPPSSLTCACAVFVQAAVSRELARLSIEKSPAANAGVLVSCGL